jgi:hypothetical protein
VPVIPAGQFRILRESWGGDLTLGLRASGSQTFVFENAFVPDHMVAPFYNFPRYHPRRQEPDGRHRNRLQSGVRRGDNRWGIAPGGNERRAQKRSSCRGEQRA